MKRHLAFVVAGLTVLLVSGCVTTSAGDKTSHTAVGVDEVRIGGGDFYEICDDWQLGQKVQYTFETSRPVNFDVHYHSHAGKVYPVKEENVTSLSGQFEVESGETCCCMWFNKGSGSAVLRYHFKVVDR